MEKYFGNFKEVLWITWNRGVGQICLEEILVELGPEERVGFKPILGLFYIKVCNRRTEVPLVCAYVSHYWDRVDVRFEYK